MSSIRTMYTDLVERRLWPVALALVAALVAVPVLLGGGSSEPVATDAPVPLAAAPEGGTAQAAISVSTPSTRRQNRTGAVRNPFIQHKVKAAPATATTTTNPATPATGDGTSAGGSAPEAGGGLPSVGVVTTPGSGGGTRDGRDPVDTWHVNLRFGEAGDQHIRHDIQRLTPLPSSSDPFFVFMGVLSDGKTAVFLVSSDTVATGDGKCKPSPSDCQTVELRAGDVEFFDVTDGNNAVTQYELDLLKVSKHKVRSTAAAAKARKRENRDGRNVITELAAEGDDSLEGYMYSSRTGLIRRVRTVKAGTSANVPPAAMTSRAQALGPVWGG